MALTTYDGETSPAWISGSSPASQMENRGTANGYTNGTTGENYYDAGDFLTGFTAGSPQAVMIPGDRIAMFAVCSNPANAITKVQAYAATQAVIPGITFTRYATIASSGKVLELWISDAITSIYQVNQIGAFYTNTATADKVFSHAFQIRGVSSVGVASTATGAGLITQAPPLTPDKQNCMYLAAVVGVAAGASDWGYAFPGTLLRSRWSGYDNSTSCQLTTVADHAKGVSQSGSTSYTEYANTNAPAGGMSISILLYGPTVQLDDYTYQVTDTGPLINNPNNSLPLWDLDSITGLDGQTSSQSSDTVDGADGSYLSAKFLTGKTIVLEGTCYANPPVDEGLIDKLNASMAPSDKGVPFYFKYPSDTFPRRRVVKPLQVTADIDRNRTLGQFPFQLQLGTEDARAYSQLKSINIGDYSSVPLGVTVTPGGNVDTYPVFYFTITPRINATAGYTLTVTTARFNGLNPGRYRTVISINGLPAGAYKLDMGARTLSQLTRDNGSTAGIPFNIDVDYSNFITTRGWFSMPPNFPTQVFVGWSTGGTGAGHPSYDRPTVTMVWADAFR